jgi:hypothetical protein
LIRKGRPLILVRRQTPPQTPSLPHTPDTSEKVAQAAQYPTQSARRYYAFPWPDHVEGLGRLRVEAFDHGARCGAGSWVRYGEVVLCLAHAQAGGGQP